MCDLSFFWIKNSPLLFIYLPIFQFISLYWGLSWWLHNLSFYLNIPALSAGNGITRPRSRWEVDDHILSLWSSQGIDLYYVNGWRIHVFWWRLKNGHVCTSPASKLKLESKFDMLVGLTKPFLNVVSFLTYFIMLLTSFSIILTFANMFVACFTTLLAWINMLHAFVLCC